MFEVFWVSEGSMVKDEEVREAGKNIVYHDAKEPGMKID